MLSFQNISCPPRAASLLCCLLVSMMSAPLAGAEDAPPAIVLEPGETPPPFTQLGPTGPVVPWDVERVGEFHLVDQDGKPVTRESLLGDPWVANFVFSRCTLQCPATCRKIHDLNEQLRGVDVRFVTITVDPEHDTVPVMKEFASIWGAKPDRWLFLTGEPAQVWDLIRKGFKVAAWENVGTDRLPGMEFAHSNHLIHVDAEGRILGRYDSGVDAELTTLKRVLQGDIQTPLKHQPATRDMLAMLSAKAAEAAVKTPSEPADPLEKLPDWAKRLPALNAMLNSLATILLLFGYGAIKFGKVRAHKNAMLTAFVVSIAFLGCYLSYHYALHEYAGVPGKRYPGTGPLRSIYYGILISHVILAAVVPVLAIISIRTGLKAWPDGATPEILAERMPQRLRHCRWAKITFPIWLYVSVTGVIIYLMLYQL